jgi:cytochrome c peroxidase
MIKVGDRIPDFTLKRLTDQGIEEINIADRIKDKKVVIFGIPGAFTGTCTNIHVPSFVKHADELKAKGIDEIICVAVNDPFVMKALEEHTNAAGKVTLLSDWDASFAKAMGLTFDGSGIFLGIRSMRYDAIFEDGVLKQINVEQNPGSCGITKADSLLEQL